MGGAHSSAPRTQPPSRHSFTLAGLATLSALGLAFTPWWVIMGGTAGVWLAMFSIAKNKNQAMSAEIAQMMRG